MARVRQSCAEEADSESNPNNSICNAERRKALQLWKLLGTEASTPQPLFPSSSSPAMNLMEFWPLHLSRSPLENSWLIWCLQQGGRDHTNIIPMIAHLTLTYSFKYIFKFPYLVPWGSSNFHFPFAHCSASSQLLRALVGIFLLRAFDVVMMVQMPTAGTGFRCGVGWFIISPWKNNLQRNSYTLNRARKIQYLLPADMITRRFLISEQSK